MALLPKIGRGSLKTSESQDKAYRASMGSFAASLNKKGVPRALGKTELADRCLRDDAI